MARFARVVVPGIPHHVTQRGNRRLQTFFEEEDYRVYLEYLAEGCEKAQTSVWAYCLMPNHVHLLLVPSHPDGLRMALGETHRRYTRRINFREGWRGHLWQERFASFPTDAIHLVNAARYIELNSVRAGLVVKPEEYRWSSAYAHVNGKDDPLLDAKTLLPVGSQWHDLLRVGLDDEFLVTMRRHESTGRPLGDTSFLSRIGEQLDRILIPQKPGRKPKKSH